MWLSNVTTNSLVLLCYLPKLCKQKSNCFLNIKVIFFCSYTYLIIYVGTLYPHIPVYTYLNVLFGFIAEMNTTEVEDEPIEKPGSCPEVEEGGFSICSYECSVDSECEGERKCCPLACGGGTCQDPIIPLPRCKCLWIG